MQTTRIGKAIAAVTAAFTLCGLAIPTAQATGMARGECAAQKGLAMALDFNVDGAAKDIWDTISAAPEGDYNDINTGWGMCPGRIGVGFKTSKPSKPTGYWDGTFTVNENLTFDSYTAGQIGTDGKPHSTELFGGWAGDMLEKGDKIPKGTKATFKLLLVGTATDTRSTYLEIAFDNGKALTNDSAFYAYGATFNFTRTKEVDAYEKHEHKFYRNYGPGDSTVVGTDDNYNDTIDTPADPSRSGYKFTGWYTEQADGDQVEDGDKAVDLGLSPDQSFYAHWEKDASKPVTHTLTFNTDGGSSVPSQTVNDGETPEEPDDPSKSGYVFDGWYADSTLTEPFDFSAPMTADATAYAKWKKTGVSLKSYTLTFDTNGGSSIDPQKVEAKKNPTRPDDPTKDGYKFGGWYSDEGLSVMFNFDKPLSGDTTIYAKWVKDDGGTTGPGEDGGSGSGVVHKVTYQVNGGTPVVSEGVKDGQKLAPPFDPSKPHYKFAGWYTDEALTKKYDFSSPVTSDLTLYAKWDKDDSTKVWTVTFDTRGGSKVDPVEVIDGSEVTLPKDPTKDGVSFIGWFTDDKVQHPFDKGAVTSDLTLYARWSSDTGPLDGMHAIYFESNGGSKVEAQAIRDGAHVVKPENPTKSGSKFAGWYSDKALTTLFYFNTRVREDMTLYAKWSTGTVHTVTFDVSSDIVMPPVEIEDGQKLPEPPTPERDGYKFTKWYADMALKTEYDFSKPVTSDMTLYAGWTKDEGGSDSGSTKDTVTVTLNSNGGNIGINKVTIPKGQKLTKPADPTKDGYKFAGWYTDSSLTKPYDFSTPVNSDITLYAKWDKSGGSDGGTTVTHTVTFNTNGGTTVSPQKVLDGDKPAKPADPTRTGYTFNGWYADSKLTTPYTFTDPVKSDITVYAAWKAMDSPDKPKTHTVTFDSQGGSSVTAQTVEDGSRATTPDTPTKSGYKFDGWYADKEYKTVFDFTKPVTSDLTVYAKWTKVSGGTTDPGDGGDTDKPGTGDDGDTTDKTTYLIHFNTNGGSQIPDQTVQAGQMPSSPDNPTKDGYTFAGWYKDDKLTTLFSFTQPLTSDVTLYAKWTTSKPSYSIEFDVDGQKYDTQTVANGGHLTLPKDPTKDGYKFAGWFTAADGGDRITSESQITKDMKLYAHWEAVTPIAKVQQTLDNAQKTLANTGVHAPLIGVGAVLLLAGIGLLSATIVRRRRS